MKKQNPKLNEILSKVSIFYGVSEYEIKSRRKNKKELVTSRHVYCYLSRQTTKFSQESIGGVINRDHATVLHSERKVKSWMDIYPDFRKEVFSLIGKIDISKSPIVVQDVDLLELTNSWSKKLL